ncbi:PadR family transcriptional regulator [Brachyspira pilosicoli]|uniref:PadR family transcriptional regulator n=1 Tax=Brachyspira pilosicoli TaxID=52584 RepID=UPI0026663E27|nr:helix-turn-helix transcriptional regulator [Brachyspira pilosicoli]
MNNDDLISSLVQELRRGTLIMVVLNQLKNEEYGYSLISKLKENGITIESNTLYPLLRRLENQGLLKSEWKTNEEKPRKYYLITEDGLKVLEKSKEHWREYSNAVNKILEK